MSRNGKNVCMFAFQVACTKAVAYTRAGLTIPKRKERIAAKPHAKR